MCVYLYYSLIEKELILINKLSKHNRINVYSCKIKYRNAYIYLLIFSILFSVIINTKACDLFTADKTLCCIVHTFTYYCYVIVYFNIFTLVLKFLFMMI
jgi:hypothetical protein